MQKKEIDKLSLFTYYKSLEINLSFHQFQNRYQFIRMNITLIQVNNPLILYELQTIKNYSTNTPSFINS